MTAGRVIRVFVSSTFMDMQGEREELVKRVFPELRHRCEQRGVTWGEVDLRWGVTDEQKAEGAVLPVCLAEIELSRPFFIGLLGERYGWVPDTVPADLAEREGWLAENADKSVTELEILHGVLNDPAMGGHAFFYLRDPAYTAANPEFTETDPGRVARLHALKDRIRASGFPVVDGYPDPIALGEAVRRDLVALVDRLYPDEAAPDTLTRTRTEQQAFAQARFAGYVPRVELEAQLDNWAAGPGRPLVVTGEPGSGKSALLAAWAARRPGSSVLHFVGASAESTDWAVTVRRLYSELGSLAGAAAEEEPPTDPSELRVAFAARLLSAGPLLLVIDGLDQLAEGEGARELAWLPVELPAPVKLVVSTLPGASLDESRRRGWSELAVGPLTDGERRRLVETFLLRFSKRLGPVQVDRVAMAPQCGNPLFLRALLDELRQWGDHFTLDDQIAYYLGAANVDDLYELVLGRWEGDYERDRPGLVRDFFGSLWAARAGLAEAELGDLLAAPRAVWSPLFLAAEQSLVSRSGLFGFFHQALRTAIEDRYAPGAAAHLRLATYFDGQPAGPRAAAERAWHHAEAGDWDGMTEALADRPLLDHAYRRDYLDVRSLWLRLLAQRPGAALAAYQPVIAEPGSDPEAAWQVARLLSDLGHPGEALTLHRFLVAHHRDAGDDKILGAALNNLAVALRQSGDLDGAVLALAEQEAVAGRTGNDTLLMAALQNRGSIERDRGQLDAALETFRRHEAVCRSAGALSDLGAALGMQGAILDDRGDRDGALALHEEQERLSRQAADPLGVAKALGAQAKVWGDRGEPGKCLALYGQQEELARRLGDLSMLLYCRANQAGTRLRAGDLGGVEAPLAEAEALAARLGDAAGLAQTVKLRALVAQQQGDLDRALTLTADLEARARALGDLSGQADALQMRATVLLARGDAQNALAVSIQQEALAREQGFATAQQSAVGDQGLARQALGDLDGALACYREQERLAREIGVVHGVQAALGNQATVLAARGDVAGALTLLVQQTDLCRQAGLRAEMRTGYANRIQIHMAMGDVATAMTVLADAEVAARQVGDDVLLRQALSQRAALFMGTGQVAVALPLFAEAEQQCRAAGDRGLLAQVLLNHGLAVLGSGDLNRAMAMMQEQEGISRELQDWNGLQGCLGNQALVLHQRGDIPGALAKTQEQEAICRQTGNHAALVTALANRGELTASLPGRAPEGLALLGEAANLAQQLGQHQMVQQIQLLIQQIQMRPP